MRTSIATRLNATRDASATRRRLDDISRRAAAVKRHWSARERSERATLAEHLQDLLLASIAVSAHGSHAIA
ncbi:MAG: hypothetical protein ACREHD_02110 [Pirellulales bacterium]